MTDRRVIDIAMCTYRRSSVTDTLASIAAQTITPNAALRVIVADNDETPLARAGIEASAAQLGLDCVYVHAPYRNIAIARNACLDHAQAPLLAFIDDDEIATPGWLHALVTRLDETGADAVLGPARAVYPAGAAPWLARADLHSTSPPIVETGAIRTGYTCNVLLRMHAFAGRRFDPALGRSGGEDDVFFASAVRDGAVLAFAPDALVDDPVPLARASLRWLCRRAFRNGQTHARNRVAGGATRATTLALALGKVGYCIAAALVTLAWPARWRRLAVRGSLHLGACAGYLGWRELQIYG